jgi:hypothetical protein
MRRWGILLICFLVLAHGYVPVPSCSKQTIRDADAAPWLTADCSPTTDKITGFQLRFGELEWINTPAVQECREVKCVGDSKTLCFDAVSIPIGPFTVRARAVNLWGSSADSLPLSDTKVIPTFQPSLRLVN